MASKLLTTANNMQQLVGGDRNPTMQQLISGDRSTNTQPLVSGDRNPNMQQLISADRNPMQQLVSGDRNPMQQLISGDRNPTMQQLISGNRNPNTQQLISGDRNPNTQQLISGDRINTSTQPKDDWRTSNPQQLLRGDRNPTTQQLIKGDWNDNMQQLLRGNRNLLMSSDDNVMMRQIQETHSPDGRYVDIKPILNVVEDILKRATLDIVALLPGTQVESLEDKTSQATAISMLDALSHIIDRISCEMQSKCLSGVDGHSTTVTLLNLLTNYPWNSKLVLTLAAFALSYGEFWLLAQIYSSNQLARSMAILKQVPVIMEHSGPLKPRFDALNNLVKSVVELTKCIVTFEELPAMYITHDEPALATAIAIIPTAVYWSMRSIIACVIQITSLTSMGHEYTISSTELNWELSTLSHKVNNILEHLKTQMIICQRHIDEKREMETYNSLKDIFDMVHIDNMRVLKALIYPKDDLLPLVDGSSKRRVSLDVLRRKNVLLLISGLDMSRDELAILEQIYNESRMQATRIESLYEVVWMPIVDRSVQWTDPMEKQFEDLRSTMPWYSVHHPSLISQPVNRFVRERWHFRNKPILVVLDPQGRELSPNAIHMMWIWGSNAFPFTSTREEALWKNETWRLELLVSDMDPTILSWTREEKYIFLYGGDDMEWIRKFTTTARAVALAARVPLEMAYVGKSNKREQVRRAIATITVEKLSYTWQDPTMVWFFWTRLESMLFSKIQLNKAIDQDPMMQEIKKLLSYDKSGAWALFCKGPSVLVSGHSDTMLPAVSGYDEWKGHIPEKGFDRAFKDYHDMLHVATPPCCRFEFSAHAGRIPANMRCPECFRHMEKYMTFVCCHDENATTGLY